MNKILTCILLLTFLASCGDFKAEVMQMTQLKDKIEQKFKLHDVGINMNTTDGKTYLKIQLVNTPYNDSSADVKQTLADSIGALCRADFHDTSLSGGTLMFVRKNNYGVLKTETANGYDLHIGADAR